MEIKMAKKIVKRELVSEVKHADGRVDRVYKRVLVDAPEPAKKAAPAPKAKPAPKKVAPKAKGAAKKAAPKAKGAAKGAKS